MDVLVIIDMLNDFATEKGALYCGEGARKMIPVVLALAGEIRKAGGKVIYLCDWHDPADREFAMFRAHAVRDTKGAEIVEELRPRKEDIVVRKATFSAFYGTELDKILAKLAPKTVHMAGVCTSICIMDTVGDLVDRGYKVVVHKDAVADFDREAHEFALKRMKNVYGAQIV